MSEKVAVIASVLKPVDDTRMFEKLGLSIRESKKYRVNIIGFGVKNTPVQNGITFHTLYQGKRVSLGRLLVPVKFLVKLFRIKPELTIVCTPELLLPAVTYKIIHKSKLWYDVQENYRLNVKHQDAYLGILKPLLNLVIWLTETFSSLFVDQFLLAERGYAKELSFLDGQQLILENKFVGIKPLSRTSPAIETKMIFSGTCSKENGILEAISFVTTLNQCGYKVHLIIAGQVPDPQLLKFIENLVKEHHYISLIGGSTLLPHSTIMDLAAQADFGLVAHQPNPSTENCIPTKVYEYLGLGLPIILQQHPYWESIVAPYQAAVVLDYQNFDPKRVWSQLQNTKFYTNKPGAEITWEEEAQKLLAQL